MIYLEYMNKKSSNYIFVDESGDPGRPYKTDESGDKISTGASLYYIISAIALNSQELFLMEERIMEIKNKFKYNKEIKSNYVSLGLYKALLNILNELNIRSFYRLINKNTYKGKFAVDGNKRLHNVFDNYNLVKVVSFAVKDCKFLDSEIVIDRSERRLLDGKFDSLNEYLMRKTNTKTIKRVNYVTHVDSEYVNAMQMSDLVSGAIKDHFTKRNTELKKVIDKKLLRKIW